MDELYFDPLSPKYHCFFGKLHVETTVKIICGIELFIYSVRAILGANNPTPQNNWQFVGILIGAFITALVFYAIKKVKPYFVIPHLFVSVGTAFFAFVQCGMCILAIFFKTTALGAEARKIFDLEFGKQLTADALTKAIIGIFVGSSFYLAFSIWSFIVVLSCYRYLKDKKAAGYAILPETNAELNQ